MKRVVLESIDGVEIYPIISLVIFVLMFVVAMYYVIRMDKSKVILLSNLPLLEDDNNQNEISHAKE